MAKRFDLERTPIEDVMVLHRRPIEDTRGFFERLFCQEDLAEVWGGEKIIQINHSYTKKMGALRGMHFQYPPFAETKMVICLRGRVWDVALDLRRHSSTMFQSYGIELSEDNFKAIVIPKGCAHGFQTLTDDCELLYLHTAAYRPDAEGGVHAQDPRLNIFWPLEISDQSEKDIHYEYLSDTFEGLAV